MSTALARRRNPGSALPPPAGGLLVRGDQRAVRRSRCRELAGPLVGRVGAAVVHSRPADHRGRRRTSASGRQVERPRGVAAIDRQGQRAVGVLVEDQLAGPHIGEGLCVGGQVALARGLDLDAPAQPDAGARGHVVVGVEPDVAEAVDHQGVRHQASPPRCAAQAARPGSSASGSSGSPASASSAPRARWAATGAKMSRPWKVADSGSRRWGERVMSTATSIPPQRSAARLQQPVVGADEDPPVRAAQGHGAPLGAHLRVHDGHVHAHWHVGQRVAQHERALANRVAGHTVGDVDDLRLGVRCAGSPRGRPRRSRRRARSR